MAEWQATPMSLLERARLRDADAWTRLVGLYQPLVLFWCVRAGVRDPDAEDIAQEAFAAAADGLADFRRDRPGDTFRGWLRVITRNAVRAHRRRNGGRPRAEGGSDALGRLQDVADPLAGSPEEEESEAGQAAGWPHRECSVARVPRQGRHLGRVVRAPGRSAVTEPDCTPPGLLRLACPWRARGWGEDA